MYKKITLISTLLVFVSCSLAPIKPTSEIVVEQSLQKTTELLLSQAEKCWKRKFTALTDGVNISSKKSIYNTNIIDASRYAGDIGLREPSLTVEIKELSKVTSRVEVKEGDWACNLLGQCKPMGFTKDVESWVKGDLACGKLNF